MVISRATTPTFEFVFPEVKTVYTDGLITFSQDDAVVCEKALSDLTLISGTTSTYSLTLTQEETNEFAEGLFYCQIRVVKNGVAAASKIYRGRIVDVLNDATIGE